MEVLQFEPLYQQRVWGGSELGAAFGRKLPAGQVIGESWEIVDRPEAQSVVRAGEFAGRTLREVLSIRGREVMGPRWPAAKPFPILVKWLDCRERLSLQVHPPAEKAAALGGEPKTENWFIAAAAPGASLIVGLRRGVTRERFTQALDAGALETCVNRFPVAAGESILVRSGTVHAIDAGNLILEIQQNSDTTYRVYDWGRVGLDGKPRQLHRREALESIRWDRPEPRPLPAGTEPAVLAACPEFGIRRVPLARGAELAFAAGGQPRLVHVVTGALRDAGGAVALARGDNALVPFAAATVLTASEPSLVLVTEDFA